MEHFLKCLKLIFDANNGNEFSDIFLNDYPYELDSDEAEEFFRSKNMNETTKHDIYCSQKNNPKSNIISDKDLNKSRRRSNKFKISSNENVQLIN